MAEIKLNIQENTAFITIDNKANYNALTYNMLKQLYDILLKLEADENLTLVILQGAGEQAFCAGGDIKDWSKFNAQQFDRQWLRFGIRIFELLEFMPQPTIALIDGFCLGGGLELALCCDIRVATKQSQFAQPEPKLGMIAGWNGLEKLMHITSVSFAKKMALFGDNISACEAYQKGLIDELIEKEQKDEIIKRYQKQLGKRSKIAVQASKMQIHNHGRDASLLAGYCLANHSDKQEGVKAFMEKRKAEFK